MEAIIIVKAFLHAPGVKYLLTVAGLGAASAALKRWLVKRGYDNAAFLSDRLFWLAGGVITIEAFMRALKLAAAILEVF